MTALCRKLICPSPIQTRTISNSNGSADCVDCQKWTGAAYTSNVVVPRGNFHVTKGTPKTWDAVGASGKINKHFCKSYSLYASMRVSYGAPRSRKRLQLLRAQTICNRLSAIATNNCQSAEIVGPAYTRSLKSCRT